MNKNSVASCLLTIITVVAALLAYIGGICFMVGVILSLTTSTVHSTLMWSGFGLIIGGGFLKFWFSLILKLLEGA